jgi:hypothetical protein
MPSNYGNSLNYQVAPAKTGFISLGEHHLLLWQFLHMRNRKRVRFRQRSLLLCFPAQIETSASRPAGNDTISTSIKFGVRTAELQWQ